MEKKEEQNYLEVFDKIFGTKTNEHLRLNMPMLKIIFENFGEDLYTPNNIQRQILNEEIKIADELENTFTDKQKELFNKYNEFENQITIDIEEQLFMFGFIIASELNNECKQNFDNKLEIKNLYKKYEYEICKTTEETEEINKKIIEKLDKLNNTLIQKQKDVLDEILDLKNHITAITNQNSFVCGFSKAVKLITEGKE